MQADFSIEKTPKQKEATQLITDSGATNILLYGGSRSGKTYLFIYALIIRALQATSRHVILRNHFTDVKRSIWRDTLISILNLLPKKVYILNNQDYFVKFANGSEIWIGGLDDKKRVDKILGNQYTTIFFNEISEMSYHSVTTAMTRLAQKTIGLTNKAFYDCNPPTTLHWNHDVFIKKQDPLTGEPFKKPKNYVSMKINPIDNLENLADNYMDILDSMPEQKRKRFRDGEFTQPEGVIFDNFNFETMKISENEVPSIEHYSGGIDFGLDMAGIKVGWCGENVYILKEFESYRKTTSWFNKHINKLGWHYPFNIMNYCDPAGGERISEITGGIPANNSVEPGLDYMKSLIENNNFFVVNTCRSYLAQIAEYRRKETGIIDKKNDHLIDASRYAIFTSRHSPGGIYAECKILDKRRRIF